MSAASFDGLPELLAEIADVAGLEAALALAEAKGGQRIYLPPYPKKNHWLVETIGQEAADKICAHFRSVGGGGRATAQEMIVPLGPSASVLKRARKILQEGLEAGLSVREAARRAGLHERTGFNAKRRMVEAQEARLSEPGLFDALEGEPAKALRRKG